MKENYGDVYINVADFIIKVQFLPYTAIPPKDQLNSYIYQFLYGFITSNEQEHVDYKIIIKERDKIEVIYNKHGFIKVLENINENTSIFYYDGSILHFQIFFTSILQALLVKNNGFILHGSSILDDGKADIFIGQKGAGKSTVINLLHNDFMILGDDSAIIRAINNRYYYYQTPIWEKESWIVKRRGKYALNRIHFLQKSKQFKLKKVVDQSYISETIVSQCWTNKDDLSLQLQTLMQFTISFKHFYFLYFAKNRQKLVTLLSKTL